MKTFDDWHYGIDEDEWDTLLLSDAWDAGVMAAVEALLEDGNISDNFGERYRTEAFKTINKIRVDPIPEESWGDSWEASQKRLPQKAQEARSPGDEA